MVWPDNEICIDLGLAGLLLAGRVANVLVFGFSCNLKHRIDRTAPPAVKEGTGGEKNFGFRRTLVVDRSRNDCVRKENPFGFCLFPPPGTRRRLEVLGNSGRSCHEINRNRVGLFVLLMGGEKHLQC